MPSTNGSDYRHLRTASLSITSQNGHSNPMISPMASSSQRFDGPRSPPNTSHVPCKFYRQGACQAGNACPFSHDLGIAAETVCKYFAKGNCKFGPKCANIHILPDGRRINYGKNGVTIGSTPIALGGRVNPATTAGYHPTASALTTSLYRADNIPAYTSAYPYGDDRHHQLGRQPSLENGLPTIDTGYSHPGSTYGSPRDDDPSRFGLGLSPVNAKGLSVLDAPLPASFDSNGISNAARYPAAPWPSSVPSKFGLESPSPSLNNAKESRTSEALKMLHTSAFGSSEHLSAANVLPASSPPNQPSNGEEYFGKRAMHSSRYAKPKMLSASLPKTTVDRDWEAEFAFYEEDYLPQNLQDLLTPAEKARRGSLRGGMEGDPGMDSSKFGSPVTGASPSRWGPLFQRQKEEEAAAGLDMGGSFGGASRSFKHASAFGHVGSPLRNSSLASGIAAELNGDSGIGRAGPGNRNDSGNESLSVLTQQLQRTRVGEDLPGSSSPHLHPNISRNPSGNGLGSIGSGIIGKEREKERGLERHVSSGSIGSNRFNPIDEEDPAFVFNMEEEDDSQLRARKRTSGGNAGTASPLSTGWSYAAAAASNRATSNTAGTNGARNGGAAVDAVSGR